MTDYSELVFLKIVILFDITMLFGVAETKISLGFRRTEVLVIGKAEYDAASIVTTAGFRTFRTRLN